MSIFWIKLIYFLIQVGEPKGAKGWGSVLLMYFSRQSRRSKCSSSEQTTIEIMAERTIHLVQTL